jgi:lantibiotic modifying enzyme
VIALAENEVRWKADGARPVRWFVVREQEDGFGSTLLGPHLGSGFLGLVVFLAALDRSLGTTDHRDCCLRSLVALREDLDGLCAAGAPDLDLPLGLFCGVGSIAYGLAVTGELLGEPSLFDDAVRLASLVSADRLGSEDRLDVMFGLAGFLLALLALARRREATDALEERIEACARRLLDLSPGDLSGGGFAHGSAGLAHALATYAHDRGSAPALARAREALDHARNALNEGVDNGSWCNGSAGLRIARVSISGGDPLETSAAAGDNPFDHLCCGLAGDLDTTLYAASRTADPAPAGAQAMADRLSARALGGELRLRSPGIVVDPRLLRGPCGAGYALLRFLDPTILPCLLACE